MGDEGGGGSFNPCECIWSHELAVRRLLNVLRNTQALCTDNECFETGATPPRNDNPTDNIYLMTLLFAAAVLLFVLRPRRQVLDDAHKPTNNRNNFDDAPPPPAVD